MAVCAAIALAGYTSTSGPVPSPPAGSTVAETFDQARLVAARFLSAARSGDRGAFQASFSTRDPGFGDRARQLFDNLRGLPLTRLEARVEPGQHPLSPARREILGAAAWTEAVTVTWQLYGDVAPAQHQIWLTFVDEGGRVLVAGAIDAPSDGPVRPEPLWWLGPVTSRQQGMVSTLVGAGQSATTWLTAADRASQAVTRQLPRAAAPNASTNLVVEVPATTADFESVVGAAAGTYAEVAAVTIAEGPTPRSAVRVVVNPAAARRLSAEGVAVTLAHEAVHVRTSSAMSPAPTWAVEGLADYVALKSYPGAAATVAAPLWAEIRRSGPPKALPADQAFAVSAGRLDLAYGQAWSVCRYLAESTSPGQLGRLYRELDQGRTLDQAATSVLGMSASKLTEGWRRWLQQRARRG